MRWYAERGRPSAAAFKTLAYSVARGRLCVVRRGVYAHVDSLDPWLIASRLTNDAVIAFDGALSLFGLGGPSDRVSFLTAQRTRTLVFNEWILQPLRVDESELWTEVMVLERGGVEMRVTSLERTFIDCLRRLSRAPEVPALVDAFCRARTLDVDHLLRLAYLHGSRLLVSRLAFFLYAAGYELPMLTWLDLEHRGLRKPDYFVRSARTRNDRIIGKWSLIVTPEQFELFEQREQAVRLHRVAQL
ncbi:MAG: type IV toxin-antitoxin system AbiEi family antitoxin domain-containing protein [Myxococcota bacterium]